MGVWAVKVWQQQQQQEPPVLRVAPGALLLLQERNPPAWSESGASRDQAQPCTSRGPPLLPCP